MTVVAVAANNSTRKKPIYNSNQRVNAKTVGAVPGLEDDLVLYPKSLALIFRELFGILSSEKQFFNGNVASFTSTEILTKQGAYLDGDNIYFLEALTLSPTTAGFWGFYELELEEADSDPASLQFFDVSLNQVSQQTVNTRKSYNIKVYENYNTAASFPTLTPGRIKWIEYKKNAAFGNIIEVNKLLNSVVLPKDKSGTIALLEDQTFLGLLDVPNSYVGHAGKYPKVNDLENGVEFGEFPGIITGGLSFNNVAVPPTLRSGYYGISGALVKKAANVAMATTDTLFQSRQSFETFCQYLVLMNKAGDVKYCLYGEGAVAGATGNISSITGAGTTKTINFATGSLTSGANKILVITGNNGVNGIFKIATNPTSSVATFESVSALTGGASGTWTVYERISTLHGVGTNTAITVNDDVLKYSPSYGENGWAASFVAFDHSRNGFYLTLPGLTDYRVIGNFRTNGSSQVINDVVSHKTGRDKNDNDWLVSNAAGNVSSAIRWSTITRLKGCDYIFVDSASVGSEITLRRAGVINAYASLSNSSGAADCALLLSETSTNVANAGATNQYGSTTGSTNYNTIVSVSSFANINMVCKPFMNPIRTGSSYDKFYGTLQL